MPDVVTDQTSAHDPLNGYVPAGYTLERPRAARLRPERYVRESRASMARQCAAMVRLQGAGRCLRLRQQPARRGAHGGFAEAFAYPGFVPAYMRPLFWEGSARSAGCALGRPGRHRGDRPRDARAVPRERGPAPLAAAGARADRVPGTAGAHLLARVRRAHRAGLGSTSSCARARSTAPIVIGRDHLDSGSVASPYRETEAMRDGSDAIADWPLLNAMLNISWARPGSRSTTAAVSALAARSTRARRWWPTARTRARAGSSAC